MMSPHLPSAPSAGKTGPSWLSCPASLTMDILDGLMTTYGLVCEAVRWQIVIRRSSASLPMLADETPPVSGTDTATSMAAPATFSQRLVDVPIMMRPPRGVVNKGGRSHHCDSARPTTSSDVDW